MYSIYIEGTVAWEFQTLFFFMNWQPPGPSFNPIKYFRFLPKFRTYLWIWFTFPIPYFGKFSLSWDMVLWNIAWKVLTICCTVHGKWSARDLATKLWQNRGIHADFLLSWAIPLCIWYADSDHWPCNPLKVVTLRMSHPGKCFSSKKWEKNVVLDRAGHSLFFSRFALCSFFTHG